MTIRRFLLSGLVLGAIGSCARNPDGIIDHELTGGFAGVHMSVHIDRDGEMTRTKFDGTTESRRLDPAVLSDLLDKVDNAEFPTLKAIYSCGGCPDDFVHTISVNLDGRSRERVRHHRGWYTVTTDGSASYPERLRPLIETLSAMSQAALEGK